MTDDLPDRLPEEDVRILFERMFPAGLAGPDVLDEIAPAGWERSPLLACFHSPDFPPKAVQQDDEVAELVGGCLWDICSDNHELITPEGSPVILGSFRESAWHIAEHAKRHRAGRRELEYPLFYMGSCRFGNDADMTPVHAMIFRRLAALGWDWRYVRPTLFLVDIPSLDPDTRPSSVDEDRVPAQHDVPDHDPSTTVRAYRQVYGCNPWGWPPA